VKTLKEKGSRTQTRPRAAGAALLPLSCTSGFSAPPLAVKLHIDPQKKRIITPLLAQGASRLSVAPHPAKAAMDLCFFATCSVVEMKDPAAQVAKQNPIKRLG